MKRVKDIFVNIQIGMKCSQEIVTENEKKKKFVTSVEKQLVEIQDMFITL